MGAMYEKSPYPGAVLRRGKSVGPNEIVLSKVGSDRKEVNTFYGFVDTISNVKFSVINADVTHNINTTLFAGYNGSGTPFRYSKIALYYFKLYDHNILVRDFIPVSYNGTPGLWDKVEWKFYANAGSGSFTLGPEKVSGIYPVSYLYDRTIYEEPDGSKWLRIAHHDNPSIRRFN